MSELSRSFFNDIRQIIKQARQKAYTTVNFAMVEAYWHIGRRIVEEEQKGKARAGYGEYLILNLSCMLTDEFGSGFDPSNLKRMRQFYFVFPKSATLWRQSGKEKGATAWRLLSWSHYKLLISVKSEPARLYYMREAAEQNWSVRALERQINSLYYERLLMSRKKAPVIKEMKEKTAPLTATPHDFIKDPYVLEFLGMPDATQFRESDLEQAIVGKLREFILELGKGFAFVARQQRISAETSEFYIDLVFYNYLLKCFVLIDLKTGKLTHQDIGQMDMYVRLYEDKMKGVDDNPTIGIILCTEKDHTVAKYSVLNENRRLFASKYKLYLPTEEELAREVEREKALLTREMQARDKSSRTLKPKIVKVKKVTRKREGR